MNRRRLKVLGRLSRRWAASKARSTDAVKLEINGARGSCMIGSLMDRSGTTLE